MSHLVIGGNGLVGTALRTELLRRNVKFEWTTRWSGQPGALFLDLRRPWIVPSTSPSVVYLVAAVTSGRACEGNPEAWRINADAPITLAKHFRKAFIVYLSSDAVEWSAPTAYARQKAQAEAFMNTIDAAIVRPAPIRPDTVAGFARWLAEIGTMKAPGIHRWAAPTMKQEAA